MENVLIQGIFTHAPPHSKIAPPPSPGSCHHTLDRSELLIPLCNTLSKICFPQQQKGAEEAVMYFIKNQSENMKMT